MLRSVERSVVYGAANRAVYFDEGDGATIFSFSFFFLNRFEGWLSMRSGGSASCTKYPPTRNSVSLTFPFEYLSRCDLHQREVEKICNYPRLYWRWELVISIFNPFCCETGSSHFFVLFVLFSLTSVPSYQRRAIMMIVIISAPLLHIFFL